MKRNCMIFVAALFLLTLGTPRASADIPNADPHIFVCNGTDPGPCGADPNRRFRI